MSKVIILDGFEIHYDDIVDGAPGVNIPADMHIRAEWILANRCLERVTPEKDWTVVIAGGWIGIDTILFSKHCKLLYSLEPVFSNYKKLVENCYINKAFNVITLMLGFWDESGEQEFNITDCSATSGITTNYKENKVINKQTLMTISWDDFVHNYNIERIDLCNIDIEGAEGKFIDGMTRVLPKHLLIAVYHPSSFENEWRNKLLRKGYERIGDPVQDTATNNHSAYYRLKDDGNEV